MHGNDVNGVEADKKEMAVLPINDFSAVLDKFKEEKNLVDAHVVYFQNLGVAAMPATKTTEGAHNGKKENRKEKNSKKS